jgi:hypothetical protein
MRQKIPCGMAENRLPVTWHLRTMRVRGERRCRADGSDVEAKSRRSESLGENACIDTRECNELRAALLRSLSSNFSKATAATGDWRAIRRRFARNARK